MHESSLVRPGVAVGEAFIPGLSDSSGDDVEEGEVRDAAPAAARTATLAGAGSWLGLGLELGFKVGSG